MIAHTWAEAGISSFVADRTELWWNERKPDQSSLWDSKIYLGEAFFNEIIRPPRPARYKHPHGPQTLHVGPRSLPLAHLPHLRPPRSATAHLEAVVPAVRSAPGQRPRQENRSKLPNQGAARVEEDQDGLAGPALCDGQGRLDPLSLEARDCTHDRPTAPRGVAPGSPRSDRRRAGHPH